MSELEFARKHPGYSLIRMAGENEHGNFVVLYKAMKAGRCFARVLRGERETEVQTIERLSRDITAKEEADAKNAPTQ